MKNLLALASCVLLSFFVGSVPSVGQKNRSKPIPTQRVTSAPQSGNHTYIFMVQTSNFAHYPSVSPTRIMPVRASSAAEAESMIRNDSYYSNDRIIRRVDNNKCNPGKFLIGWNEYKSGRYSPYGIAAIFVHCGFNSDQEAITKGVLDSGKPFWRWQKGDANGPTQLHPASDECIYSDSNRQWNGQGAFCALMQRQVPVLVDREPQEVINILP